MKTKKAIIFDLDGVIVDTAKYHFIAWKKIAEDLGVSFTKEDNELLKGVSRVQSLEKILIMGKKDLSQKEKDQLLIAKNKHYLSLISHMDESELLPGISKLLNDLDAEKIPYALGSASKNAKRILDTLGLTHRFAGIVDGTHVTKAKPDPEVFLIASEMLHYHPLNCIVIEDSVAGIQAANSVGMTSIGIGDSQVLHEANFVLENTSLLSIDFIKKI